MIRFVGELRTRHGAARWEIITIDAYTTELVPSRMRGRAFAVNQAVMFVAVPIVAALSWWLVPLPLQPRAKPAAVVMGPRRSLRSLGRDDGGVDSIQRAILHLPTAIVSPVVPANAGTHNHCCLSLSPMPLQPRAQPAAVVMGPGAALASLAGPGRRRS
jgi:hypothetical protein